MKLVCLTLLVAVSSAFVLDSNVPTSTPLFMWSGTNRFSRKNVQVLDTLTYPDVQDVLANAMGNPTSVHSSMSGVIKADGKRPRVVVIASVPELRADQVSKLSDASSPSSTGGAFSHLKNAVETSQSSVTLQYVETTPNHLEIANDLSLYLASLGDFKFTTVGGDDVDSITFGSLNAKIADGTVLDATRTNVFVLRFSESDSAAVDETLSTVMESLEKLADDDFIGVATTTPSSSDVSFDFAQYGHNSMRRTLQFGANTAVAPTIVYFTPGTWMGILASVVIFLMICPAIVCICHIQSPRDFRPAKK